MMKYPSNSERARNNNTNVQEGPRTESENTGVKKRTPNALESFVDRIFNLNPTEIISHTVNDIVAPAIVNTIYDTVEDVLFSITGIPSNRVRTRNAANSGYKASRMTNYNECFAGRKADAAKATDRVDKSYPFTNIDISSRVRAYEIAQALHETLEQQEYVSVADVYMAAGLPFEHTDENYGWYSLYPVDTMVVRTADGFTLRFMRLQNLSGKD